MKLLVAIVATLWMAMCPDLNGYSLFDDSGTPTPPLARILQIAGMPCDGAGIDEVNAWAQENLLRRKERWDEQSGRFDEDNALLLPLLDEIGLTSKRQPVHRSYAGALLHGALMPRAVQRIDFLVQLWKEGVRFPVVYVLTGDRPLDPIYEPCDSRPAVEWRMIEMLWTAADMPREMRDNVEVIFIRAPMRIDAAGMAHRPTTDDTVHSWVAANPARGCYLAISNAPYTARQDLVMRTLAPQYEYEAAGPAFDGTEPLAILLDELARLIYQTLVSKNSRP